MESDKEKKHNRILVISSYPPRKCGIATFTQDLTTAFDKRFNPAVKTEICAINNRIYNYNSSVVYQINASDLENYVLLAREINSRNDIKIVNIQHEFGLFGGKYGNYLVPFLRALGKPIVVTFHSIIPRPDKVLRKVVGAISDSCDAMVVMNKSSKQVLEKDYKIASCKISYIPHGIPQVAFERSEGFKKNLGYDGKIVLSTFGLVGRNKGIEYAIRALPEIAREFPNVIYLVIGETHPSIPQREGKKYRRLLYREVSRLGLGNNVKFFDKYATLEEIIRFLQATDIYISTSIDKNQSVSGTLSYALGCGRPVVSTATEYAKNIIDGKNGVLVKTKNSKEISKEVIRLISDEKTARNMAARAYRDTRPMIWSNIAQSYLELYNRFAKLETEENKLLAIKFDHIVKMTDDFGIIQHARYNVPEKKFGYSLDDVSRALIACAMHYKRSPSPQLKKMMDVYIKFIDFAKRKDGSFTNIVSSSKKRDNSFDEDAQGRTVWGLGYVISLDYLPKDIKDKARGLLKSCMPLLKKIKAPRAKAFAIIGLYFYLKINSNGKLKNIFKKFSYYLLDLYKGNARADWSWFEDSLTYSNSKLPEALFYAYDLLKEKRFLKAAKSSLNFLESITLNGEFYMPIGQKGWYAKNKQRSYFDQQPEDASSMVQTEALAYEITKNKEYLKKALKAFHWFLGKNHLRLMVYDETTGGCNDGLGEYELNLNQGAESTICYAMARLLFEDEKIKKIITKL